MSTTGSIISIASSRRNLVASKENEIYVAVKLTAPKIALSQRQPTAIAVALDISGSMADPTNIPNLDPAAAPAPDWLGRSRWVGTMTKLDVAKFALRKLVENLTDQDSFALISFDDYTTVEFASAPMTGANKSAALQAINRMASRGATNLSDGLYAAIVALKLINPSITQRVMLFTDGAANRGDLAIAEIERGLQMRFSNELPGISTFGIGQSYNGELLGLISRGGGAHYYIDTADRIPIALGTELGTLASIYAKNVELTLVPAEKTEIVEVINGLKNGVLNGRTWVECDDLYSEQVYSVVFKMKIPKRAKAKSLPILTVQGKLKDVATGGTLMFIERLEVNLSTAKDADKTDNPDVMSAVALQLAAKSQREAMDAAKKGDFSGARRTLSTSADVMRGMGRGDLATVNSELMTRGYASEAMYRLEGSKLSASLGGAYSRQTAGMGGTKVGGVDVDSFLSNSTQKQMANAFSIVKSASPDDQMPDVEKMVTQR